MRKGTNALDLIRLKSIELQRRRERRGDGHRKREREGEGGGREGEHQQVLCGLAGIDRR